MNVTIVNPHGYCVGVHNAMAIALKAKEEHPNANVYLLGLLIHNEEAIAELESKGLIVLDERKKDLLDYLLDLKKGDVVVFSAHGHPSSYDDLAKAKGLILVDATCRYVSENTASAEGVDNVIYVGLSSHLESQAFLANCPDASFYDVLTGNFPYLRVKGRSNTPTIITQTTLSGLEVEKALADITHYFPDAILAKQRCFSTTLRQSAIAALPEDIEEVIVLGSKRSNNSLKLAEIASSKGFSTHLCLGLEDVKALDLKGKKKIALSSGASTSEKTFQDVLTYLKGLD